MRVEIRTTDSEWAAAHGTPGRDGRVTVDATELGRTVIGTTGREMVTFCLDRPPSDWPNTHGFAPIEWVTG